jgi:hypothetical protein
MLIICAITKNALTFIGSIASLKPLTPFGWNNANPVVLVRVQPAIDLEGFRMKNHMVSLAYKKFVSIICAAKSFLCLHTDTNGNIPSFVRMNGNKVRRHDRQPVIVNAEDESRINRCIDDP